MTIAFPHSPGKGGPGSFQTRFEAKLKLEGHNIVYPNDSDSPDVVMVVGGTQNLRWLYKMKRKGIPIILRLDGINWIHRKTDLPIKVKMLVEIRNLLVQFIRTYIADYIVYQSQFSKKWWESKSTLNKPNTIIYNGVDLQVFRPNYENHKAINILFVEGTLDYSPYAIDLINKLEQNMSALPKLDKLILYGSIYSPLEKAKLSKTLDYRGSISRTELPGVYRNAIYLSLDVNPACPNTVIEALASGLPVVAYDTGALPELVPKNAGEIVKYGGDPWAIDTPDFQALLVGLNKVADNFCDYAIAARKEAETRFSFDTIYSSYIDVIKECLRG